ncbi:sugar phosphate isomerase/epimerase family protein [Peptoniphilus lacrimalis]|uniref:Xylose isomerase-like TIM barrel n=1 Tax=Peptoniphilus lacrimalis TaxID=33031 RepID=A0A379C5D1_9FIRM|nr:sugar phosphate isomerase/epimerase [Peptoniphilus lacrimalis]SUB57433.1 Xylose isomerase-like TIM barrel [Peptoniphilus lacrimalis]
MIYISTNMYKAESFEKVYKICDKVDFPIGIEVFLMFGDNDYYNILKDNIEKLKKLPITFHEPYYGTDHTYSEGEIFQRTNDYLKLTHEFSVLNPKYMVYHYNNRKIDDREKMLEVTRKNLDEFSKYFDFPLLIENVGVKDRDNVLLNQDEFIEECLNRKEGVLIDIGHANANSWKFEKLISSLKGKIKSYHLHTNDGIKDEHRSIFEIGKSPIISNILKLIKEYTPNADLVLEYSNYYEDKEDLVAEDVKKLKNLL